MSIDGGKVSKERLNQIAGRKLASLGINAWLRSDGQTVEGELGFSGVEVKNPVGGAVIASARFTTEGHDHLKFLTPPLSALPPIKFYETERVELVVAAVRDALRHRGIFLEGLARVLRSLKVECRFDPLRLVVLGRVRVAGATVDLVGAPDGVRLLRVTPDAGKERELPANGPILKLDEFSDPTDLELHLAQLISDAEKAPSAVLAPAAAPSAAPKRGLVLQASPELTIGQLQRLGDEVCFAPGTKLELFQEFEHDGVRYRFSASQEKGDTFRGTIQGPKGARWAERFNLSRFPGVLTLASAVLGVPLQPETPPQAEAAAQPESAVLGVPDQLAPAPGEVWVMSVLVDEQNDKEVRYTCTDIDGKPYGAQRVLAPKDFSEIFVNERGGWRLLIQIDAVSNGTATYRQMDRERKPRGQPKQLKLAVLVTTFCPEAASY